MPSNPHWYTLRRTWANDRDFIDAVQFIRDHGVVERFPPPRGRPYTVLVVNGFKYWTMGAPINDYAGRPCTILINRKAVDSSGKELVQC